MLMLASASVQVAQLTAKYCNASVCVYDIDGTMLASVPEENTAGCSREAINAIRSGRQIIIDEKLCNYKKDLRQGIILPVNFNGSTIFAVGLYGNLEKLKPNISLIAAFLSYAVKSIFLENQSLQSIESKVGLLHALIDAQADQRVLKRFAFLTGFHLDDLRICIVASPVSREFKFNEKDHLKLYSFLEEYQPDVNLLLSGFIDDSRLVILLPLKDKDNVKMNIMGLYHKLDKYMTEHFKTSLRFSVSSLTVQASMNCSKAFTQAERVDSIEKQADETISYYDEQGLQMILSYVPEDASSTYCQNVAKLMNDTNESIDRVLLETLRVFFQNNLNISETSRALFLHRNTLIYRLQKIEDLTGKNPRHYRDAVELYIMLILSNKTLPLQKADMISERKRLSK